MRVVRRRKKRVMKTREESLGKLGSLVREKKASHKAHAFVTLRYWEDVC